MESHLGALLTFTAEGQVLLVVGHDVKDHLVLFTPFAHTMDIFLDFILLTAHLSAEDRNATLQAKTTISVIFIGCHKVREEEHVPHFTYLMTKQQRLGVKLFAALMAGQFGGIACPALCRFHGVASLGLSWHRGGRDGRVGRHKWGH